MFWNFKMLVKFAKSINHTLNFKSSLNKFVLIKSKTNLKTFFLYSAHRKNYRNRKFKIKLSMNEK
jgi:hypothetical protein